MFLSRWYVRDPRRGVWPFSFFFPSVKEQIGLVEKRIWASQPKAILVSAFLNFGTHSPRDWRQLWHCGRDEKKNWRFISSDLMIPCTTLSPCTSLLFAASRRQEFKRNICGKHHTFASIGMESDSSSRLSLSTEWEFTLELRRKVNHLNFRGVCIAGVLSEYRGEKSSLLVPKINFMITKKSFEKTF